MCAALGRPELEDDPLYADISLRAARQDELIPIVEQWMQTFDSDQAVLDVLEQNRVPSSPVLSPIDAQDHISEGRWGINIVSGWSGAELGMMGAELGKHGERYRRTAASES
jgi:crotonobetainyl-CoA:carnitine CoA-transferase CaiB-like acyl-CoA transferase